LTTRSEEATGDCFVVAFGLCQEHGWTLCHGLVVRPSDGVAHPHAWAERTEHTARSLVDGETSWRLAVERSNGHDAELPAAFYRNVGKAHDVREYTPEQARMLAHEAGHFGPWE
jgi:hypothetical protein